MKADISRKLVAEFFGTAMLLATVVGSSIMAERLAGGNVAIALLANTVATGAALVALILTFGPISGAHFNPVVSICDAWQGGISMWGSSDLSARSTRWRYIRGDRGERDVRTACSIFFYEGEDRSIAMARRVRRDFWLDGRYMGMYSTAEGDRGSVRRRSLHHGGILVHIVDVVCEPGCNDRTIPNRHIRRNTTGRRSGVHHRPIRGRDRGDFSFPMVSATQAGKCTDAARGIEK